VAAAVVKRVEERDVEVDLPARAAGGIVGSAVSRRYVAYRCRAARCRPYLSQPFLANAGPCWGRVGR
jgi:hypothetical protein